MSHPLTRLAALWGPRGLGHAIVGATVVLALTAAALVLIALGPVGKPWQEGLQASAYSVTVADDQDADGLPDATENLIGSKPDRPDTLGRGVPDGWIHHWYPEGLDWNETRLLDAPVLVPPAEALPPALREQARFSSPTLADLYRLESERTRAGGLEGAWWLVDAGLDPHEWDNDGDEVADAWLLSYGLHPRNQSAAAPSPGDPEMSLRQKYDAGLDPTTPDTDSDGLRDADELSGSFRSGPLQRQFQPTDPHRFSTRSDGLADGYVVRIGLDPHTPNLPNLAPGKWGVTVEEAFRATRDHCDRVAVGGCNWLERLQSGPIVDPTAWDSNEDGVPDAWALRDPNGIAHPLEDARKQVLASSSAWDGLRWNGDPGALQGVVVDSMNAAPTQPRQVTVHDAYAYQRPSTWQEARDGPWWGGLPTKIANATLPVAVSLRGWDLQVDGGLGGSFANRTIHAGADPRKSDTDGDGLSDLEEYFGVRSGSKERSARTNPLDPDTDGDGLRDPDEVRLKTNPLRRDTAGGFLPDGDAAAYWTARYEAALAAFVANPDAARLEYSWLIPANASNPLPSLERLKPDGVLPRPAKHPQANATNILTADSDGDTLKNGAELMPMQYLEGGSGDPRPATDPARRDTDGDTLPDDWEVYWSKHRYYSCPRETCHASVEFDGWPLNPALKKSVPDDKAATDADVNLAGDDVQQSPGVRRPFSNALAYKFDLDPYAPDTNGDGLPDMFSIHWGVESANIPEAALTQLGKEEKFAWAREAKERISSSLDRRAFPSLDAPVVIDPSAAVQTVTPSTNLLGMFDLGDGIREKGTWRYVDGTCLHTQLTPLPASGTRREIGSRAGLMGCWLWVDYPLRLDVAQSTNPWDHDFDDDGLPDAWELAYNAQTTAAAAPTAGSLASGCAEEESLVGLPPPVFASYCLSHLDAFGLGVDPRRADTDGGGSPDWLEVVSGTKPLDREDDYELEDWDGDGLTNKAEREQGTSPMSPDSDHDGLADGGYLEPERGDGDLCIGTGSAPYVLSEHRPGGRLNQTGLYNLFIDAGVVFRTNACSPGQVLFLSEGVYDPAEGVVKGSGFGTDPTSADTDRDGVPDGWIVYWRDRSGLPDSSQVLDPNRTVANLDPDGDFRTTLEEYRWARPTGWMDGTDGLRPLDGPWWGGLDPSRTDSDHDSDWFTVAGDADDLADGDADNDGLVDAEDPYPGLDPRNEGLVRRNASTQRYEVDYARLWPALLARTSSHQLDTDTDGVPNALDLARIHIDDLAVETVTPGTIDKRASFNVTGRVETKEPPAAFDQDRRLNQSTAPDGSGVEGATVLIYAKDSDREELVGVGFTGPGGAFRVLSRVSPSVEVPPVPEPGAVVAGALFEGGEQPTLDSQANLVNTGPITLAVVVQGTDPGLQALKFWPAQATQGVAAADAYKRIPFQSPLGGRYASVVLENGGGGPDLSNPPHVVHAASGIFGARSTVSGFTLKAPALLQIQPSTGTILAGDLLTVKGSLTDDEGDGLANQNVTVTLKGLAGTSYATTQADGKFQASLTTTGRPAGTVTVRATVVLSGSQADLLSPAPAERDVELTERTQWTQLSVAGLPAGPGVLDLSAGTPLRVQARLVDHRNLSLPGRAVSLQLSSLTAGLLSQRAGATDAQGRIDLVATAPTSLPLETLNLTVATGNLSHPTFVFLRIRIPTVVQVSNVTLEAGQSGHIVGVLRRASGEPLASRPDVAIAATSSSGGNVTVVGTNATGGFRLPIPAGAPAKTVWTVRFLGTLLLQPSPNATATSIHMGDVKIRVDASKALRDRPLLVPVHFEQSMGSPVSGTVQVGWKDGVPKPVAVSGSFARLPLPPRNESGTYPFFVHYLGNDYLRPAREESAAAILTPVNLTLQPVAARVPYDLRQDPVLVQGTLRDDRGAALSGRSVEVVLVGPRGDQVSRRLVTDADGALVGVASALSLPGPGNWSVTAQYAGSDREDRSTASSHLELEHEVQVVLERWPTQWVPGSTVVLEGRLESQAATTGTARLQATLGGHPVAGGDADRDAPWTLLAQVPYFFDGQQVLEVSGLSERGYVLLPAQATVQVPQILDVEITETPTEDGRWIDLQLVAGPGGRLPEPLEIVVLERDGDGRLTASHIVPVDASGSGRLKVAGNNPGNLTVLGARSARVQVEPLSHELVPLANAREPPTPWWAWAAGAAAILALALAVSFYAWKQDQRRRLRRAFAQAHRTLLDPAGSPRLVVRQAYQRLLEILTDAGYPVRGEETPRDIAAAVVEAFDLPPAPLREMTHLFEVARYSELELGADDRARALTLFRQLSLSVQPAAPQEHP